MSLITRMRKQKAIWWKRNGYDEFGKAQFDAPIEVKCRWEDVVEEFVDAQGNTGASRSKAYVDRIMSPGDRLKRGTIDFDTEANPLEMDGAYEIRRFDQLPNLRNSETLYTAYL